MRALKVAIPSLLLLVPSSVAAAAVTGLTTTFKGKTSQNRAVVIHVAHGDVASPSRLSWAGQCSSLVFSGVVRFAGRLHADGSFDPSPTHSTTTSDGLKLKETTTVRFTVHGHTARGTFTSVASAYSRSGTLIKRCVTPKVTFTAHG